MNVPHISIREKPFYIHYQENWHKHPQPHYHIHDDYEIYYLMSGKRKYTINDADYFVEEGSLVFVNRNTMHMTSEVNEPRHSRFVLNFKGDYIPSYVDGEIIYTLFDNGPHIIPLHDSHRTRIQQLFFNMEKTYKSNANYADIELQSKLTQLLLFSYRLSTVMCRGHEYLNTYAIVRNNQVSEMIDFIQSNYMHQHSLSTIAQHFHMSAYHLSRLFKTVTGMNITSFLSLVRITEAKKLLQHTSMNVSRIASIVGFSTITNFNRVFKEHTGVTPTQYRNE